MHAAVRPIDDEAAIRAMYQAPEFQVVGHDHRPASPVFHPAARYLGAYVGDALAGLFLLIRFSALEIELHALILRRHIRHARDLGRTCLAAVFADPQVQRATAYVIEGLESARNYTLRLGFKAEGMRRAACQKGGRLVGVHVMGMTRADWEASL